MNDRDKERELENQEASSSNKLNDSISGYDSSGAEDTEKNENDNNIKTKNDFEAGNSFAGEYNRNLSLNVNKNEHSSKRNGISKSTAFIMASVLVIISILTTYTFVTAKNKSKIDQLETKLSNAISASERLQGAYEKIAEIDAAFKNYSVYDFDQDTLEKWMINGYLTGTGDTYAYYYTAEEMKRFFSDLNGESEGIGISVIYDAENYALEIISVFPGSSGEKAGVLVGDKIVTAGEEKKTVAELGYEGTVAMLRGEAGTKAVFTVYRNGEYVDFEVERAEYTEVSVTAHICSTDASVGIIRISSFNTATVEQFKSAIKELTDKGAEKLVFDVRYNPGGELNSVCQILDLLLPEGPIIRASSGADKEISIIQSSDKNELNMPMAVLVNGSTASAGELFTAALKDYNKAVIVGVTTYGKGTMQSTRYLSDGSGLKLTTEYYYPPFSDNYNGVGISPDVVIEQDKALENVNFYKITDEQDTQLQAAIAAFNK